MPGSTAASKPKSATKLYSGSLNFIKAYKDADPADFDRPDTSEMTPEQKDWFDRRDAELKRREEEQGIRKRPRNLDRRRKPARLMNAGLAQPWRVNGEEN